MHKTCTQDIHNLRVMQQDMRTSTRYDHKTCTQDIQHLLGYELNQPTELMIYT